MENVTRCRLGYRGDLCSRMAWQYDSKKFQQESDVICIPFAVPYIFQRDRANVGEPQRDACGHEQSNHKRGFHSRKNCLTPSNLSSKLQLLCIVLDGGSSIKIHVYTNFEVGIVELKSIGCSFDYFASKYLENNTFSAEMSNTKVLPFRGENKSTILFIFFLFLGERL